MPSRTKDRISATLFDILQKKAFDKITVKEVVEVCDVTRQTFYYHFQDLMDVLEWSMQSHMKRISEECLKEENPIDALRIFIDEMLLSRPAVERLFESQHRGAIEKMLMESVRGYLRVLAAERKDAPVFAAEDEEVAFDFYTCAIVGTILSASMRPGTDADVLAHQLYRLLYGQFLKGEA